MTDWARYESVTNLALAPAPATIMCPYDVRSVPERVIATARRTHPELAENGGTTRLSSYLEPEEFLLTTS